MHPFLPVAVRALFELGQTERVVRTPLPLASVRDAPLRYTHRLSVSFVGGVVGSVAVGAIAPRGQHGEPGIDLLLGVGVGRIRVQIEPADEAQSAAVRPA
jgi:hypothetical protein